MLDYSWSLGDEALRDGRNQPPKPECPSGSATYVLLVPRAITKTEGGRTAPVGAGEALLRAGDRGASFCTVGSGRKLPPPWGRVGRTRNGGPIK